MLMGVEVLFANTHIIIMWYLPLKENLLCLIGHINCMEEEVSLSNTHIVLMKC